MIDLEKANKKIKDLITFTVSAEAIESLVKLVDFLTKAFRKKAEGSGSVWGQWETKWFFQFRGGLYNVVLSGRC